MSNSFWDPEILWDHSDKLTWLHIREYTAEYNFASTNMLFSYSPIQKLLSPGQSHFTLVAPNVSSTPTEWTDGQNVGNTYKITSNLDGMKLTWELQHPLSTSSTAENSTAPEQSVKSKLRDVSQRQTSAH